MAKRDRLITEFGWGVNRISVEVDGDLVAVSAWFESDDCRDQSVRTVYFTRDLATQIAEALAAAAKEPR